MRISTIDENSIDVDNVCVLFDSVESLKGINLEPVLASLVGKENLVIVEVSEDKKISIDELSVGGGEASVVDGVKVYGDASRIDVSGVVEIIKNSGIDFGDVSIDVFEDEAYFSSDVLVVRAPHEEFIDKIRSGVEKYKSMPDVDGFTKTVFLDGKNAVTYDYEHDFTITVPPIPSYASRVRRLEPGEGEVDGKHYTIVYDGVDYTGDSVKYHAHVLVDDCDIELYMIEHDAFLDAIRQGLDFCKAVGCNSVSVSEGGIMAVEPPLAGVKGDKLEYYIEDAIDVELCRKVFDYLGVRERFEEELNIIKNAFGKFYQGM